MIEAIELMARPNLLKKKGNRRVGSRVTLFALMSLRFVCPADDFLAIGAAALGTDFKTERVEDAILPPKDKLSNMSLIEIKGRKLPKKL